MDGHGSVTALAKNVPVTGNSGNNGNQGTETVYGQELTDTYVYDDYGNLLKKTGTTDNDYLYTGEQYNGTTGLYYLRARYLNPETGTFISMDSYAGTLDNPVSLHKYLYANANPVMYIDPSGNFSLVKTQVAQAIRSTLDSVEVSRIYIENKDSRHRCSSPEAKGGYRFTKAMANPGFIGIDQIRNQYLPMGFSQFKIEGRGLGSALVLEFLLYYMTKPEYQIHVREELYLDNMLDLF